MITCKDMKDMMCNEYYRSLCQQSAHLEGQDTLHLLWKKRNFQNKHSTKIPSDQSKDSRIHGFVNNTRNASSSPDWKTCHLKDHEGENLASHHLHLPSSPRGRYKWRPKQKKTKHVHVLKLELWKVSRREKARWLQKFEFRFGMVSWKAFIKIKRQLARVS